MPTIEYNDEFGQILDWPENDMIEIRWFDTTATLDANGFQQWLTVFAAAVEKSGRSNVLTDSTSFTMDMAHMSGEWRDTNIIPRYNAAGVRRFAFHLPTGSPPVGALPVHEGPATYLTAYFDTRASAVEWLSG